MSIPNSGLKVLVIDDSNTIRRSAEIFLKQGGHDVLLAEDGFDALAKVNDFEPNLIFCDILMPRLDGYQTCAIIKRNARFSNVPIVMLSSKDGVFDKARGRMVGSQDYLTKPFTKDQLLQTVQKVRRQINPKLKIEGILLTMTDSRTIYGQQISNLIRQAYGKHLKVFDQTIPRSVRAAETSTTGKSIFQYDPKGKVAEAYHSIAKGVLADAEKRLKRQFEQLR